MKSRKQVLKKLFLSTLYLSAFTFGGGYVIVTQHSWLSLQEFADLVAIAVVGVRIGQSSDFVLGDHGIVPFRRAGTVDPLTAQTVGGSRFVSVAPLSR